MLSLIAGPAAWARARQNDHTDPTADPSGNGHRPASGRGWALLEALANAGVYIDPTGALIAQRLRQAREAAREEAARHARD